MQSIFMKARSSLETKGRFAAGAVPEAIADSWHRCLQNGLDPMGEPIDAVLSFQELRERKEKNERLIAIVRPELELLSNQIAGTNYMTAFADDTGVVLDAIMDSEFSASDCARSIRSGSIWSEDMRGTNALGLALHTGATSMVTGGEHFFSKHGNVSCVSTPIFDSKGQIVGLLDASSEVAARQFHTQALVALAASNIENRLFIDEHRADNIIQFHPRREYLTTQSVGMISTDGEGAITGVNRHASDLLKGMDLGAARSFADLFQGGFGAAMKPLEGGEVIRLIDWLNAAYFARIRITRKHDGSTGAKRSIALSVPAVFNLPTVADAPVYRDEQLRNSLRMALRSARVGAPFTILGPSGSGRTTLARTVHEELHKDSPLIVVDCRTANALGEAERLMADILGDPNTQDFNVRSGGTLVLENLALIHGGAAEKLAQVTNRLSQLKSGPKWVIVTTGSEEHALDKVDWPQHIKMAFSQLTRMKLHLPPLAERTDFAQVAGFILSEISHGHQLSNSAVEVLRAIDRPQNLNDLAIQLRVLAVQCPLGVIREEAVERHLGDGLHDGQLELGDQACPRCAGHTVRELKCLEINRVFRQCNGNVALAARKLGVSRNTVYTHIKSPGTAP